MTPREDLTACRARMKMLFADETILLYSGVWKEGSQSCGLSLATRWQPALAFNLKGGAVPS